MKQKLKKFSSFVEVLLPQEVVFLNSIQQFDDVDKASILEKVTMYALGTVDTLDLDISIDKRKYSLLLQWMKTRLERQDVDNRFRWINKLHADIMLDRVEPSQEVAVIKSLSQYKPTHFYFFNYYEMLKEFRQHLLVRRQFNSYEKVAAYIQNYQFEYQNALIKRERINEATKDILIHKNQVSEQIDRWEKWMVNNFQDVYADGHNRYLLFVRLCFIYLATSQLDKLEAISKDILQYFNSGKYYSRRLLLNFYDNMLVLYDRKQDYRLAEHYGRLSIKGEGQDKLLYFNNYVNILIKQGKYRKALEQIDAIPFKLKDHKDVYSIIGYIANHIRCLSQTGESKRAVKKGEIFLSAYHEEIWQYRWYRFFVAYVEAMFTAGLQTKLLSVVRRHKLIEKEAAFSEQNLQKRSFIKLFHTLANFLEGNITKEQVNETFDTYHQLYESNVLDQQLENLKSKLLSY